MITWCLHVICLGLRGIPLTDKAHRFPGPALSGAEQPRAAVKSAGAWQCAGLCTRWSAKERGDTLHNTTSAEVGWAEPRCSHLNTSANV